MSFERVTAGTGLGAEPAPAPRAGEIAPGGDASPSMRLQILSTEHWSLLVALALVAQASAFGDGFTLFALVILPVVLFIGVATFIRLGSSNYHEAQCVIGMNRIRAAYLELAPDLERYFVMSAHDDLRGVGVTMGVQPGDTLLWIGQIVGGTPTVIMILNAVLAGAIAAIAALRIGAAPSTTLIVGVVTFLIAVAAQGRYASKSIARAQAEHRPLFPTPVGEETRHAKVTS